ncbi:hypothetical protein GCM10009087_52130 [Sphingomonas oligophenolica]|uniref:Uncharacterized protein n=1 Tax=Sphingomonas oligophenolica TaxID=301154 RepID=A0ABU9Y6Y1_9SPHN
MPVVPIEENKVGIASLTDAKLRPADLSGSGLDAIGSGLRAVGSAGMDLGKAVGSKPPAARTDRGAASAKPAEKGAAAQDPAKAGASDNKPPEAEPRPAIRAAAAQQAAPPLTLTPTQAANDAAVKRGYCDYVEATRPVLDPEKGAPADRQGVDPAAATRARSDQLIEAYQGIAAGLSPEQHEALHGVMPQRLAQDQALIRRQEAAAAQEAQRQQSQRVVDTSADDAVLHYGTPAFGQSMATGLRQIEEQAAETRFISGVHRKISESYAGGDVILGAEHLRLFGAHMTSEDRDAAWQALSGPLIQTQAVADADTPGIANAPTAPLTPQGDPAMLVQRMLAITPAKPAGNDASGAGDTTDLPALVAQYGGDAAKAWAASAIGTDALDALVAQHGARWFGALPKDARNQVAANMAMLGAATSPRRAPTPAERGQAGRRYRGPALVRRAQAERLCRARHPDLARGEAGETSAGRCVGEGPWGRREARRWVHLDQPAAAGGPHRPRPGSARRVDVARRSQCPPGDSAGAWRCGDGVEPDGGERPGRVREAGSAPLSRPDATGRI